jgi:hypothetical protein
MMHHGMPFQQLSSRSHAKDKHGWVASIVFSGNSWWHVKQKSMACEAKKHGHDSKQRHQVEGPIMQAKEWMREFGWCNLSSTRAQNSQSEDDQDGEN